MEWLSAPRIDDPVDRRNAPYLQLVLLLLVISPPLLWGFRIFGTDLPWRPDETAALASSMVVSATALCGFLLTRRGHFQWAVRQLLVVVAAMMLISYGTAGLAGTTYEQPLQVMWLFAAGTMVNRRALWAMYAVLVAALFLGATVDARTEGAGLSHFLGDAVIRTVMFGVITLVVDRASAALRGALDESIRHGRNLEATNARLAEEIEAREQAQARLLHARRVEAASRMANGVAHDFNHLISLALGYVSRARAAGADEHARLEALEGIESAARRATAVTAKLLSFSREEVGRVERFDATLALRELAPMLRQTLSAGSVLELELPDGPCPVELDHAQFDLVLLNLAGNAADAMADGGRLEVTLRQLGHQAEVRVRDTGEGMPAEVAARVFEPFFTTKPSGRGTGLGLAVAADVIRAAGGEITVDSRPGAGTTFTLCLPLACPVVEPAGAAPAVGARQASSA